MSGLISKQLPGACLTAIMLCLLATSPATAGDPLFESSELLEVSIAGPFQDILDERHATDYFRGRLSYRDGDETPVDLDVRIRTRGNFRRENCDYPPVWLKFRKSEVRDTLFEGQRRLKLVVHCERGERFEQSVLREYLAYRLSNEITDKSFRARLLRVTYVNTADGEARPPRYAFLIEHKDRLAERIDRREVKVQRTTVDTIDGAQLNLSSVFQYFIGNTDFSPIAGAPGARCCHNYVLFGHGNEAIWAIPYDFDQSGFVDAPYAAPNPRLGIRSVSTRLYRGRCHNNAQLETSLQHFREHKSAIYALVSDQQGLSDPARSRLLRFVDGFYATIDDPRRVRRSLVEKCLP